MKPYQFLKIACAILLFSSMSAQMQADNSTTTELNKRSKNPSGKPQAPSRQLVEVTYQDGYLFFTFQIEEGLANVQIFDFSSQTSISAIINTAITDGVYIGSAQGGYMIVVETSNENIYEGYINLYYDVS